MTSRGTNWVDEALRAHDELTAQAAAVPNPHDGRTKGSPQPLPGTVREEQVLQRIEKARARKAKLKEERITLSHGSGGKATQTLI